MFVEQNFFPAKGLLVLRLKSSPPTQNQGQSHSAQACGAFSAKLHPVRIWKRPKTCALASCVGSIFKGFGLRSGWNLVMLSKLYGSKSVAYLATIWLVSWLVGVVLVSCLVVYCFHVIWEFSCVFRFLFCWLFSLSFKMATRDGFAVLTCFVKVL